MSKTFIFRPLVASEASRWSIISSFEARSPFVYSIRIPAPSFALPRMTRNCQKAKGLRGYCTGAEEAEARVGRERPGALLARRTRGLGRPSFDARSREGNLGHPLQYWGRGIREKKWKRKKGKPGDFLCLRNARSRTLLAWSKSTSRRARGWAGGKVARTVGKRQASPPIQDRGEHKNARSRIRPARRID